MDMIRLDDPKTGDWVEVRSFGHSRTMSMAVTDRIENGWLRSYVPEG